ncbi:signal peptidase I [Microbacterium sp. CFBP9034]|uniref:signal peptidase I n=1 Tax=Microbacterium sp. CFBP9034 TaxID=3096540 RepID=UPI002A69BB5E|nr:signal peptidase I [Microbacterium sp. CFBP9034]MDY0910629.1 signal peptidase I [Microbacterium sp. CFBP9034]
MTAVAERPAGARHPLSGFPLVRSPRTRSPRARRAVAVLAVVAPVLVAALAIGVLGVATVRNGSMSPTLHNGDLVIYDRWSAAARGDIVLLADREEWSGESDVVLVKRVIGVAGDVVVCCESGTGRLLVNDQAVVEPYAGDERPGGAVPFRVTVPEGSVWVMGDNREASVDSRSRVSAPGHGAVARADLRGVVRARWAG